MSQNISINKIRHIYAYNVRYQLHTEQEAGNAREKCDVWVCVLLSCLIAFRRQDLCPAMQAGDTTMLHTGRWKGSWSTGESQSEDQTRARSLVQTLIPLLYKYTVGLLSLPLSLQLCTGQMAGEGKHNCNLQTEPEEIHKRWPQTGCDVWTKAKKRDVQVYLGWRKDQA